MPSATSQLMLLTWKNWVLVRDVISPLLVVRCLADFSHTRRQWQ
jgi:hypothetical protein